MPASDLGLRHHQSGGLVTLCSSSSKSLIIIFMFAALLSKCKKEGGIRSHHNLMDIHTSSSHLMEKNPGFSILSPFHFLTLLHIPIVMILIVTAAGRKIGTMFEFSQKKVSCRAGIFCRKKAANPMESLVGEGLSCADPERESTSSGH